MTDTPTPRRTAASRFATVESELAAAARSLTHIPHPHLARRAAAGPVKAADQLPAGSTAARLNTRVALLITRAVGSMWCAYLFAAFDLFSLPTAVRAGTATIVAWVAQTFLQLVLLSVIMVGQNVQAAAGDARAKATFDDGEAVLHYVDGHARSLAELHTKLDEGLAAVHVKLDKLPKALLPAAAVELNLPAPVLLGEHVVVGLAEKIGQKLGPWAAAPEPGRPAAAATPFTPVPPPAEPAPPAAAPPTPAPPTPAPPSSPPADGPAAEASTS